MNPHFVMGTQFARFKLCKFLKVYLLNFFLNLILQLNWLVLGFKFSGKKFSFADGFFLWTVNFDWLGQGLGYSGDSAARVTQKVFEISFI